MKGSFMTIIKKPVSLIMSLCMIFSLCSTALVAYATADDTPSIAELIGLDADGDGTVNYVSIGASNTNGYGHRGYLPEGVTEDPLAASKAQMNTYGYKRTPANAYPALIAKALEGIPNVDKVDLQQLAISSMRVEELRFLLDETYPGDAYLDWRFYDVFGDGEGAEWFKIAEEGGLQVLRDAYQNAVADADLITIDMGWNNFGVYAFNNIKTILADGDYWKTPDFSLLDGVDEQIHYDALKQMAFNYLKGKLGMADAALLDKLDKMADVMAYAALGACYHFNIVMEKIYEANPDANVVVINIQNLADGLVVDFEGNVLELGELYGKLISVVDNYRRTASPYAEKYMFADVGDVTTFFDEMVEWDGDPNNLSVDVKDCFDMYDDNLYVRSIVEYLMVGQALSGLFQGVRDQAAVYGIDVFKNDTEYTYEFAISRTPDQLLSLDLAKLDLKNPAGADKDVEEYGKAVSQHLKNLRGDGNLDAYDYVFEGVIEALEAKKGEVKDGLGQVFAGINNAFGTNFNVNGYYQTLTGNGEATVKDENVADFTEKFYADYTAEGENKLAKLAAYLGDSCSAMNIPAVADGISKAAGGYAEIVGGITQIVPTAKETFGDKLKGIYTTYQNTLNYAYDVVATFVQYVAKIDALEVNADSLHGFNAAADGLISIVANDFINGSLDKFNFELYKNGLSDTKNEDPGDYVLDETDFDNAALCAIAVLAVRYEFGNSFFAHPNTEGHEQIAEGVLLALARGTTAKEDSQEDMVAAWGWFMDYVKSNHPEVYEACGQMAAYIGSEEFQVLSAQVERLYKKFDAATTPEQKALLANETYKLMNRLQAIAAMASADKLDLSQIDHYVSIGDSTLSGYGLDDYVIGDHNGEGQTIDYAAPSLLAKKIFGADYKDHIQILDKGGLRTNEILVYLGLEEYIDEYYEKYTIPNARYETAYYQNQYQSAIAKADLITLTMGGGDVSTFVEKQILAYKTTGSAYALDWAKYFPDADLSEIYGYIDEIETILDGMLPEIMGVEAENLVPIVAESFLYGLMGYFNNYAKIVDRIHEINPDAHIVLVGYFNTVDGMMLPITVEGETIQMPVGDLLGLLVETSNANTVTYALAHNDHVTYVSTSDATTILDEKGLYDYESRLEGLIEKTWLTHAGPKGHEYIANQLYAAITTKYTNEEIAKAAADAFADYFTVIGEEFGDDILAAVTQLVNEYYDEAYAYGYQYAKENGYIAEAVAAVDAAIAAVKAVEIDAPMTDAFKAEVEAQLAEAVEALEAAKALILEADALDKASLAAVMNLLDEAVDSLEQAEKVLVQAGVDVNNLVIIPAINEAVKDVKEAVKYVKEVAIPAAKEAAQAAAEKAYAYMVEAMGEAYDALVEAIVEAIETYLPVVDEKLYDYFYNNPEEVIEFVKTYGPYLAPVIEEYGAEALALVGFALATYGDDMAAYIVENHEQILADLAQWGDTYGERVIAMLQVYAEALGYCDALREQIAIVEAEIAKLENALGMTLEELLAALQNQSEALEAVLNILKNELANKQAELEALKAMLENAVGDAAKQLGAAIENIEETIAKIEAAIEAVEAAIAEVEAKIAEIKEAIAQIDEKVKAQIEEIKETIAKVEAEAQAKIAEIKETIAKLQAQAEALKEQLKDAAEEAKAEIEAKIAEIEAKIAELNAKVEAIIAQTKATVEELNAKVVALNAKVEAIIAQTKATVAEVAAKVEAVIAATKANADKIADIYSVIVTKISTMLGYIEEGSPADNFVDATGEAVEAFLNRTVYGYEETLDAIELAYQYALYDTTHGEYVSDCTSKYVALGNTAYVAELAAALGLEEDQFAQYALSDIAKVAGADLVTVNFDNGAFQALAYARTMGMVSQVLKNSVVGQMMNNPTYGPILKGILDSYGIDLNAAPVELDWNKFGAEVIQIKDKALETVAEELAKNGIPEIYVLDLGPVVMDILNEGLDTPIVTGLKIEIEIPVMDLLVGVAETALYGYFDFAAQFPVVLNNIRAIAPEAQVVVTGIDYLAADTLPAIITANVNVGEYLNQVVDALNLHLFAYAAINTNTTYVAVDSAEAVLNALTVTQVGHVWGDWYVTRPATPTVPGEERRDCQNDGCICFETREIPESEKMDPEYTVPTGLTATYGDTLADVVLPEGFTWKDATQSVGNAGTNTFIAIYTPADTDNYNTVEVVVTVEVAKADPAGVTAPANITANYGDTLADVVLPEGFTWKDATQSVGNAGTNTFIAIYTPADTDNYNAIEVPVTITIAKVNSSVTTHPAAVSNLVANGTAQALVQAGTAAGGTMVYSLNANGPFSATIPTATDAGTYTVYYKVQGDANHNDTAVQSVSVTVYPGKISSNEFTVETSANIRKVEAGTTVAELLNGINEKAYVTIYNADGTVAQNTDLAATGMVAKLIIAGRVVDSVTVIVTGDVNGDGKITITDMMAVKLHVLEKTLLTGAYLEAGDTQNDGNVTITDFMQIKFHILEKSAIEAN